MKPYEEDLYTEYVLFRIHKQLQLYVLPLIVVVGVVGNTLSVLILTRPSFRRAATYTYLTAVAIADTLVLFAGAFREWLAVLTDRDPRNFANWSCKTTLVFTYTVSDFSVWLLIAVTAERYLAVSRPLRVPTHCTRQRAVTVILGLLAAALALNAHFAWTVHVESLEVASTNGSSVSSESICQSRPEYGTLVNTVWPWVDFICYFCLPFVTIAVFNSLIIHRVVRARRRRGSMSGASGSGGGGGTSGAVNSQRSRGSSCSDEFGVNTKLAMMLMTVSFAFLLLALPLNTLIVVTAVLRPDQNDVPTMVRLTVPGTVSQLLMYTNHAVNFYLYCATGQKFRRQLYAFVCRSGCLSGTGGLSPPRNDVKDRERGPSLWRDGSEGAAMHPRTTRNPSSSQRIHQPSKHCNRMVAESAL